MNQQLDERVKWNNTLRYECNVKENKQAYFIVAIGERFIT
jgi:hypothetical protein